MGREVRRVPPDWNHPKDAHGRYKPLLDGNAKADGERWDEGRSQWDAGLRDDWKGGWVRRTPEEGEFYEDWSGTRPDPREYMPDWPASERSHFQMYETCSEGTPISPVCESPEELARWCADNGASAFADQTASYEAWLRVAKGGYAPSAIASPALGLVSGVEGMAEQER